MTKWPDRLTLRDTKIHADEGQRIYTTATGYGYEKCEYIRADLNAPEVNTDRSLVDELTGALRFIMAFYEPGQRYLDTEAWKHAEAGGRRALARGEAALKEGVTSVPQLGGAPDDLHNLIKVTFADMSIERMNEVCQQVLSMRKVTA
ncbi:hypothetical protein [Mesorhizobium sp. STM 4661]|uniref:hypothetical protein n=1 Tax=Mesorhizobium sp. STM 4661 TaxID=1297570 RepID=UPI0002BEBD0C|nr:hypothetical protein [Mesorhizobium sp. STM 4661]CCV12977.1 hypothetical protein MESS4_510144 [Mesorhizobium sp. STM 4661]